MSEEIKQVIRDEISRSIKTEVNGKIDKIQSCLDIHIKKHEQDMEDMKPYMQAAAGGKFVYGVFKILVGIAVGWVAIKSVLPNLPIQQ